jgi:hypothetical protein
LATKDIRRHHRIPYVGPVRLSWEDQGRAKFVMAKCVDISETGLRVEVSEPIPVRTNLQLRAERINLGGSASVKHSVRYGSKYLLGLQLSQLLQDKTLTLVREPWSLRAQEQTR